jgi:hypothetical protein
MYSIMQKEEKRLQKIKKISSHSPAAHFFFKVLALYLERCNLSLFRVPLVLIKQGA